MRKNINKQRLPCSFSANKTAEEILKEREQLDRRRLEHAHLQYALLQMIHFFPGSFILKKISFKNFSETITNLAPSLHEAFTVHYAGRTRPAAFIFCCLFRSQNVPRPVTANKSFFFFFCDFKKNVLKVPCLLLSKKKLG